MSYELADSPNQANLPTKTWVNPRWSATPEWLRPIIQSLEAYLARPYFYNGIQVGDGTVPSRDPETGVKTSPPVGLVDAWTLDQIPPEVDAALTALAERAEELGTDPIPFTRITNVSISTPMLEANAITAEKLAALYVSVGKFIRSSNFATGSTGWAIDGNGNAEFNNVTVRGTIASSVVSGSLAIPNHGKVWFTIPANSVDVGGGSTPSMAADWTGATGTFLAIDGGDDGVYIDGAKAITSANWSNYISTGYGYNSSPTFYSVSAESVSAKGINVDGQPVLHSGNWSSYAAGVNGSAFLPMNASNFVVHGGGYTYGSDESLKEAIVDTAVDALAEVLATPVRGYTWRANKRKVPVGFVAQEAPVEVQRSMKSGGVDILGLDLGAQVAMLWRAVQQLAERDGGAV